MTDKQQEIQQKIKRERYKISAAEQRIKNIAKEHIPDFHWMDFAVSTFWTCEVSPIGMCVFHLNDAGLKTYCRYCGGSTERK